MFNKHKSSKAPPVRVPASFRELLAQEEEILWVGQPQMNLFGPMDLFVVPFMMLWTTAPVGWLIAAYRKPLSPESSFEQFSLSLFALIGLYMVVGRFVHEALRRKFRFFIVTNRRIFDVSTFFPGHTRSIFIEEARNPEVFDRYIFFSEVDSGSLHFTGMMEDAKTLARLRGLKLLSMSPPANRLTFYDLKNPQEVLGIIKNAVDVLAKTNPRDPRISPMGVLNGQDASELLLKYENEFEQMEESEEIRRRKTHANNYVARTCGLSVGSMAALTMGTSNIYTYSKEHTDSQACKTWPSVQGKVAEIEVRPHKSGGDYLSHFSIEYKVDGTAHKCDKYSFDPFTSHDSDPRLAFAKTHKVGDSVSVFYNPAEPGTAVMVNEGAPQQERLAMGVGFDFIGVAIVVAIVVRMLLFARKRFPETEVKSSMGAVFCTAAFLSVWCTMFFGAILSPVFGAVICKLLRIR